MYIQVDEIFLISHKASPDVDMAIYPDHSSSSPKRPSRILSGTYTFKLKKWQFHNFEIKYNF